MLSGFLDYFGLLDELPQSLWRYILKIARLGGYLARAQDPTPGNIIMWRGWARLNDIILGATITTNTYG